MKGVSILSILALASLAIAQTNGTDSNVEEPTIVSVVFRYNPNKIAAGIAGGLYFVASLVLFIRLFSHRTWWGLCLPIAAGFMAIGFFMRIPMAMYPNSLPIFMIQQLYILLPPAAYLAFNYILYGRFIVQCVDRKYSWIRPEKVAKYFVASDITTFLIQGGGGGMQASTNITSDNIGARILLGGLVLQTLSFAFFMALVYHAYRSITKDGIKPSEHRWGTILRLLFFSSTFFMIRCVYRTIELGQGNGGYLITHEIYFYLLDSLPLLIGISTYIFFWPTKYFEAKYPSTVYDNIPLRP